MTVSLDLGPRAAPLRRRVRDRRAVFLTGLVSTQDALHAS